jgi:hypothetical protein
VSYYDFDKHFWPSKRVCAQSTKNLNQKNLRPSTLTRVLSLACVLVWTPLLIQILVHSAQDNHGKNLTDANNLASNCFVLKRDRLLLCRFQNQQ